MSIALNAVITVHIGNMENQNNTDAENPSDSLYFEEEQMVENTAALVFYLAEGEQITAEVVLRRGNKGKVLEAARGASYVVFDGFTKAVWVNNKNLKSIEKEDWLERMCTKIEEQTKKSKNWITNWG